MVFPTKKLHPSLGFRILNDGQSHRHVAPMGLTLATQSSAPPEVKLTQHGPGPRVYKKLVLAISYAFVSINHLVK